MSLLRATGVFLFSQLNRLLLCFLFSGLSACGAVSKPDGITANMLVLVTDASGSPVSGATVWIPADSPAAAQLLSGQDGLALVDEQGNTCADPPASALFVACTDAEGIALLPCGGDGVFLLNYFKDAASGVTSAKCGGAGVVPAPFDP